MQKESSEWKILYGFQTWSAGVISCQIADVLYIKEHLWEVIVSCTADILYKLLT